MEYDVFIRDRLTEWDAVITALTYRDYDSFKGPIGVSVICSPQLLKYAGVSFEVGAEENFVRMITAACISGRPEVGIISDVGETEFNSLVSSDPFRLCTDLDISFTLIHSYLYGENKFIADSNLDGILYATCLILCEDITVSTILENPAASCLKKYFPVSVFCEIGMSETSLHTGKTVQCESAFSLNTSADVSIGRYHKLEEFDAMALNEMDKIRLNDLDFESMA